MPSRNLLLRALGPALEHLRPHLTSETFTARQVLKADGQEVERVYFPIRGLISSRVVLESGHEIECALIGSTNAIGALGALGLTHGWARFVCLTDGAAWSIGISRLAAAARTHPSIERQLVRFCFAQMGYTAHLGVCNAMHSVEQRLARWLCNAADLLDHSDVTVSQDELATILGVQRSAVSPALQRLKDIRLLDVARARVRILDPHRLKRHACECLPRLSGALFSEVASRASPDGPALG